MNLKNFFFVAISLILPLSQIDAGLTYHKGRIVDPDDIALCSVEEHYQYGCEAYHYHDWKHAIRHFHIVSINFPDHPCCENAKFYLGVSYYYFGEHEFANTAFSNYLKSSNNPEYLEDAIEYKFLIAEEFRAGAKRHIYGSKMLPAWLPATEQSIEIYDEIITSFPCHSLAAKALTSKAAVLWGNGDYRESVEAYLTLIRRFPKHEKAPESYLLISRLYLDQAHKEFQNPDILALAQLNFKKFEYDFPSEERLEEARYFVQEVKETFAKGLYDTGQFFERCKKTGASVIYYQNALQQFPDTAVAEQCRRRMMALDVDVAADENLSG
ncbi:MAG: Outer membrane protein assembly factor BamD [Chlamydiae bacterium]|nr:Outer membrane protein assembly factor BamD [Chlamydiota bacterium]